MEVWESGKRFLLFYMLGFLAGIIYMNAAAGDDIAAAGIFNEYFLNRYAQTEIVEQEYIWYLFRVRIAPIFFLAAAGCFRFKKIIAAVFLLWTGILSGVLCTTAVMKMGILGIVLCLAAVTPQIFFYFAAYLILLRHMYCSQSFKWDSVKIIAFALFFFTGLVLEGYVNPVLMKMLLKII